MNHVIKFKNQPSRLKVKEKLFYVQHEEIWEEWV